MTAPRVEMACQELVEVVTEYLEGTLAPSERKRFEAHLGRCDGCMTYLEQMRQMLAVLGRLAEESIPDQVRQDLLRALRDWKSSAG